MLLKQFSQNACFNPGLSRLVKDRLDQLAEATQRSKSMITNANLPARAAGPSRGGHALLRIRKTKNRTQMTAAANTKPN